MDDLISRSKAIEQMNKYGSVWIEYTDDMTKEHVAAKALIESKRTLIEVVKQLPSAQPEIIVCEDCKWRISENRKTTSLWLPCRALVTPDQFSCIYAERREVTT